jgi:glutathione S-transferase
LRYSGTTVPGLRIDQERLVGSRTIMRRLDALVSEPPLLPAIAEPVARARVLEAERWGDEVLQSVPRRIIDACFMRDPSAMESYAANAKLPLPTWMMRPAMPLTARLMARRNSANDELVQADLLSLPTHLELIDSWIKEGVIGADTPNAGDLQIGSSIRLLQTIGDVRPMIEGRAAAQLVRYFPPMAGDIPAGVLPAQWLVAPSSA